MANVNYIVERETFARHARDNGYTGNEQLFWYALFTIFNERANRNAHVWPDGFIRITNKELLSWLPFTENTLNLVRASMINPAVHQPVLVEYIKGRRHEVVPQYKMNWFTPQTQADDLPADDFYLNSRGNMGGNAGGNMRGNAGGMMGGILGGDMGDISININNTLRKTQVNQTAVFSFGNEDDNEDKEAFRAYERAKAQIRHTFGRAFGRMPTPAEENGIARDAQLSHTLPLVHKAVELAAYNGAKNPAGYIGAVCQEWGQHHLHTEDELSEYIYLRDSANGKHPFDDPQQAEAALRRMRFAGDDDMEALNE